ncbi:IRK-interacting protein-like [Impatiens glandulifera]|uniref:IRK-interacting protein-like n=1 Tax=Impatiens glandulifera TaxID=253017 RepID=UPI001FB0B217|nr:IRK-interacting protein-like [Impatiens glandulifera]
MASQVVLLEPKTTHNNINKNVDDNQAIHGKTREELQTAIANALELRALHAAALPLLQQGITTTTATGSSFIRYPVTPPPAEHHHHSPHLSSHDYPVFTPSYEEDERLWSYRHIQSEPRAMSLSECWDSNYTLGGGGGTGNYGHSSIMSDFKMVSASARRNSLPSELSQLRLSLEDHTSVASSRTNVKSRRRNSLVDPPSKNNKNSNIVVPLTDSHASGNSHHKNRGLSLSLGLSRLLPKMMRKKKEEVAPTMNESEVSIELMKRELMEANESRDAALNELADMSSSLMELKQKLEYLESYCEDLKKAIQSNTTNNNNGDDHHPQENSPMPVTEEVMVEGFLQIVSEARLSIRQFCKNLLGQIDESDGSLVENLNSLLHPYKLSITPNQSKTTAVLHHLEAIINQALYQDFENSVFQKNGAAQHLDPVQDRLANFSAFVSLRNLSWNEVLMKGTKYYSEELSKFCDQKMNCIITTLNWTRLWPEQLLQSFFVAAKCVRLLHLLAFSFKKPIGIFRVEENSNFDGNYMEDVLFADKKQQQQRSRSRVKVMVMPGFYVQDKILKSKVICKYKSVP